MDRPVRRSVSEAIARSTVILFKPFSWNKWVKLIFIGWLAGTLYGGMGYQGLNRQTKADESAQRAEPPATPAPSSSASLDPQESQQLREQYEKKYWFENSLFKAARNDNGQMPAWVMAAVVWPIIILIIILILVVVLFFIWLSSRFHFVWLYAVKENDVVVGTSFRRYSEVADSLMLFNIVSSIISFSYFAAILLPCIYSLIQVYGIRPELMTDILFLVSNFWPVIALAVFSIFVLLVVYSIVTDFIVPIMAEEKVYFMEACRSWMPLYKKNRFNVWRYFLMKIVALIVGSCLTMVLMVPVLLVMILLGAILFGSLYLILMAWLKWNILFWIMAVLLGVPFFIALSLLMGACMLPLSVFMRAYSLSFLGHIRQNEV